MCEHQQLAPVADLISLVDSDTALCQCLKALDGSKQGSSWSGQVWRPTATVAVLQAAICIRSMAARQMAAWRRLDATFRMWDTGDHI